MTNLWKCLNIPGQNGIINYSTGGGKTIMIFSVIGELILQNRLTNKIKVIFSSRTHA